MNRNFFSIRHEIGGVVDKTPEVKVSQSGVKYYRINIVSKDFFQKKDGTTGTKMEFHNLTMFVGNFFYDECLKCKSGDIITVYCEQIQCDVYQGQDGTNKISKSIKHPSSVKIIKMDEEEEEGENTEVHQNDEIPAFE